MQAILFDFDGVLTIDKYGSDSILRYLSENTPVPIDTLKREYYKINRGLLYGEYTHKDIWAEYCKNVGCDIDFQILIDSFINTPLDFDMLSLVRELKTKYKIGMITDNKIDRITEILRFHNLTDLFDVVTISAECKCSKNDRKIFDITLENLNIEPSDCIFIDNSEKNLIVPQELGIRTILFDDENRDIELFRKQLNKIAANNAEYQEEYQLALNSLLDIRRLFLRALSLFYFSDILVSSSDSVVLHQIAEIQRYIKVNKKEILDDDIYGFEKLVPKYNKNKFANDLNVIEAYCMNILLSYTAEQHSVYQGKRYNALTVDYGYFYSTTITQSDRYYNYANIKPRMFLLGYNVYYFELLNVYKEKLNELRGFDCPKELRKELKYYVNHKDKRGVSAKEFLRYAKWFEKQDDSRNSSYISINKFAKTVNPLLRLNPTDKILENNVGSFELDEIFPQKKFLGVCSMLAAGKGWKVDTVRYVMAIACCFVMGAFVYFGLALAKKMGYYFGVNVERP